MTEYECVFNREKPNSLLWSGKILHGDKHKNNRHSLNKIKPHRLPVDSLTKYTHTHIKKCE